MGAASIAEAQPLAPLPDYHWCPGQFYDPGWGNNWDWDRCHDDVYFDGEPHDAGPLARLRRLAPGRPRSLGQPGRPGLGLTTVARAGITTGGPGGPGWNDHRGY